MTQAPNEVRDDFDLTVVVPAHNEEVDIKLFLEQCIESLPESLKVELLVIDDGSVDSTVAVVKSLASLYPCIRIISWKEKAGLAAALTKGIEASRGSYITWLPADNAYRLNDLFMSVPDFKSQSTFSFFVRSSTSSDSRPLIRQLVTMLVSFLILIRFRFWVFNYSGIFLGQSQLVRRCLPKSRSAFFTYELMIRAKNEVLHVEAIPLKVRHSGFRKSRIFKTRALLHAFGDFIKFRFH